MLWLRPSSIRRMSQSSMTALACHAEVQKNTLRGGMAPTCTDVMRPCAFAACMPNVGRVWKRRTQKAAGPDVRAPVCLLLIDVTCTAGKSWSRTGSGGSTPPHDENGRTGRYLIPYLLRVGTARSWPKEMSSS